MGHEHWKRWKITYVESSMQSNETKWRMIMTRLQIIIKDADKADILINLLKELPFVEIEKSDTENSASPSGTFKGNIEDLFGIWEGRDISLKDIREKAWIRKNDSM